MIEPRAMDTERLLQDARLLRRVSKFLNIFENADIGPDLTIVEAATELLHIADRLQNQACGFTAPAADYDTPPKDRKEEHPVEE